MLGGGEEICGQCQPVKMILWVVFLISHCCWSPNAAAASLERIEHCGTRCSQGLRCKTKPQSLSHVSWFHPPCQKPAEGLNSSSVFHSISLSTVMRCEGKQKCSLHLRIKTELQLTEAIHGMSICTVTPGMMANCRILGFTKGSRERMSGMQVAIENDCTDVAPGQNLEIRVTTVPHYCGITWTGSYEVPGCSREDLSRCVPDCITGRLSYDVNPQRQELNVSVSDMLQDHNYHLRLCHKDFICTGTGARTLIKKEDPVKSATFQYERLLPCLCIEGWSAVTDAPRIQVCPFKDRIEELWSGISFEPLEGKLLWEPACPVPAVVALCQIRGDGVCVDLPHASRNVSREKITFTEVDPHPQLCMKFTAGSQSWTRCPFADERFQAWKLFVSRGQSQDHVKVLSQTTASFSVRLCAKSNGSTVCQATETHTMHVEKHKAESLNLEGKLCNSCLQVRRLNVTFAATVVHCHIRCNQSSLLTHVITTHASGDLTWVVPAGVFLCAIIVVSLVLHLLLTVHHRKKQKNNRGSVTKTQAGPASDCSALRTKLVLHGGVLMPDSPQCGNTESATLISD